MIKPRMTIVESVYHQIGQEEPTSSDHRFSRLMDSEEQLYIRQVTLDDNWKPLDLGWIEKAGMLIVSNKEGAFPLTKPTKEETENAMSRIVELGMMMPDGEPEDKRTMWSPKKGTIIVVFGRVRPQESLRFEPVEPKVIVMRCVNETAKISYTVIPA